MVRVPAEPITFGPFSLDVANTRLLRDGMNVEVRPQALHVLQVLVQNSGRHVGYDQMLQEAWSGNVVSKHTVAVTVGEVKKILESSAPGSAIAPAWVIALKPPTPTTWFARAGIAGAAAPVRDLKKRWRISNGPPAKAMTRARLKAHPCAT
jgi:hypothetical protein